MRYRFARFVNNKHLYTLLIITIITACIMIVKNQEFLEKWMYRMTKTKSEPVSSHYSGRDDEYGHVWPSNSVDITEEELQIPQKNLTPRLDDQREKRFPDCIIIGVMKGGTGALQFFLTAHPRIIANENITEYHFFETFYEKGIDWYRDNMPLSLKNEIVIEKSAEYFRTGAVPERIYKLIPDVKLLLIVRDPVQRALSHYHFNVRHSKSPEDVEPFDVCWRRYARGSTYDSPLEQWLNYFPRNQMYIVDGDAFSKYPVPELNKVEEFLNIEHYFNDTTIYFDREKGFYCRQEPAISKSYVISKSGNCLSKEKGHTNPTIPISLLNEMKTFLRPHNEQFYRLSGMHFNWDL